MRCTIHEKVRIRDCEGVYSPAEDSLLLADAVERFAFGKVLDLGTGSGIQGIVAAMTGCEVTFTDVNPDALECARKNAQANGVPGEFVLSDLFENVEGKFNTIIFNPPYVPSRPLRELRKRHLPLDGGKGGREVIDRFLGSYRGFVEDRHAVLMVESSPNDYMKDVETLKAEIVGKAHYFFEDIVVLKFQ